MIIKFKSHKPENKLKEFTDWERLFDERPCATCFYICTWLWQWNEHWLLRWMRKTGLQFLLDLLISISKLLSIPCHPSRSLFAEPLQFFALVADAFFPFCLGCSSVSNIYLFFSFVLSIAFSISCGGRFTRRGQKCDIVLCFLNDISDCWHRICGFTCFAHTSISSPFSILSARFW